MTVFQLNNEDKFVTRIKANPNYYLTASHYAVPSVNVDFVLSSSAAIHRTYLNKGHYYYISDHNQPDIVHTSSITFRKTNPITDTKKYTGLLRLLCQKYYEYWPNEFNPNFDFMNQYTVISIPKAYYGNKILENSFFYSQQSGSISIRMWDNGSGSLYGVEGTSGSIKVGNIFYHEGILFVSQSSFGPFIPGNVGLSIEFSGSYHIYSNNIFCHVDSYQANYSMNDSFSHYDPSVASNIKNHSGSNDRVFVTGIGIYDREYKLVASAKFSQPIRKKNNDKLLFKLRLDQ